MGCKIVDLFEKLIVSLGAALTLLILLSVARIIRVPGLVVSLAIVFGVLVVAYLLYRIWLVGKDNRQVGVKVMKLGFVSNNMESLLGVPSLCS